MHTSVINEEMKVAAIHVFAKLAHEPVIDEILKAYKIGHIQFGPNYIIHKPFDSRFMAFYADCCCKSDS